jgi:hypothetical protein
MPNLKAIVICAVAVATAFIGSTLTSPSAEAGSYWNCRCKGVAKRFVYGTYACEADRERELKSGKRVSSGFKLYVPRCDRAQSVAFRAKVCAQNQCRVPRAATAR